MKKKIVLLLSLVLVLAAMFALHLTASAAEAVEETYSGTCGEALTWTLNTTTGELVISGTGAMDDWKAKEAPWYSYYKYVKSIVIEEGVTVIGSYAFYQGDSDFTDSLVSVQLPSTVVSIKDSAFAGCELVSQIVLPENLTEIGKRAFLGWRALVEITIPGSVETIGESAFSNCYALATVNFSEGLVTIQDDAFMYASVTSIKLPSTTRTLGTHVFYGCKKLTSCSLNWGLESIGQYALSDTAIITLYIPSSVKKLDAGLIADCTKLIQVSLGTGITELPAWFADNTPALQAVYYHGTEEWWGYLNKGSFNDDFLAKVRVVGCNYTNQKEQLNDEKHTAFCVCGNSIEEAHTCGTLQHDSEQHKLVCNCGYTKYEAHSIGEWKLDQDATVHYRECACGLTEYEAHTWDEGVITVEPQHLSNGEITYTCTGCNTTKVETVPNLEDAHEYDIYQIYDRISHRVLCACGTYIMEEHRWDEGVVTQEPTHTEIGKVIVTCLDCDCYTQQEISALPDHIYGEWLPYTNELHQQTCVCGVLLTEAHTWNDGEVITTATHLVEGSVTYTCTDCGATKVDVIPKLPEHTHDTYQKLNDEQHTKACACGDVITEAHTWDAGKVTTPATHTMQGEKLYTCTGCSATKTETIEKVAAHEFGKWEKLDSDQHKHTCICGAVETAAHIWDSGKVTTSATHTTTGEKIYTCTDCGATKTEVIEKVAAHEFGKWEQFDSDKHKHTCICGAVETAAHIWDSGKVTTPATHTTTGEKTYTCTDCGATKTEVIEKIPGHTFDQTVVDEKYLADEATCEEQAKYHVSCACGEAGEEVFPAGELKPHAYGEEKVVVSPTENTEGMAELICEGCGHSVYLILEKLTPAATQPGTDANAGSNGVISTIATESPSKGGCSASVGVGSGWLLLLALTSVGVCFKKKRR